MKLSSLILTIFSFALSTICISALLPSATAAQRETRDVMGGAHLIFNRPNNPEVRKSKAAQGGAAATPQTSKPESTPSPSPGDDDKDKVEDALALGNIARDRQPPDFDSAEKAYRLAWKLNQKDPRPLVGLGNVYFDQGRFSEAARAYKEALELAEPATRNFGGLGKLVGGLGGVTRRTEVYPAAGEWHAYLATAIFRLNDPMEAEEELRQAISSDPRNANWRARLGYVLFAQKRFTEASESYKAALELDPTNETYKDFLRDSLLEAEKTSTQDLTLSDRLKGTRWEIRESETASAKGTCELRLDGALSCKSSAANTVLYTNTKWRVVNGLFQLQRILNHPCVGQIEDSRILLRCPSTKAAEFWTKPTP